ncbi:MAG TPA: class I SAM-dependent methyltransferase, partial [Edaphobacter sp.]
MTSLTQQGQPEHQSSTGARPIGVTDENAAATAVQQMFDTIAPRYDLLNHLLSVGLDRWWWSRAARVFRPVLQRPEAVALDLCCGTGDMTLALLKHRPKTTEAAPILALDFSHQMLSRG